MTPQDIVKAQIAAHWNRRAPRFDEDFDHTLGTVAERAAWDRILRLVLPARGSLAALDVGCGTGFLSFELAALGHRVVGVDFAPAMIAEARRKAAERALAVTFEEGDAEQLAFAPASFDLVISRHVLWTLPRPEAALDEWVRVLRPGGRVVIFDSQPLGGRSEGEPATRRSGSEARSTAGARSEGPSAAGAGRAPRESARTSAEYAPIREHLPFLGGRSREDIEALLRAHGLAGVASDPLVDLLAAQEQRALAAGREPMRRRRYAVWGDVRR